MITLHIGLHKTGSSSIQFALRHAAVPASTPILVPQPGTGSTDRGIEEGLEILRAARAGVLSDENLLGTPFDGYADMDRRVAMIDRVLADREYQVLVYLRPQHAWLSSVFTQHVQQGGAPDVEGFWERMRELPNLQWSRMLAHLRAACGAERVVALPYSGGDVVTDFLHRVNVPAPALDAPVVENVSIAAVQIPLLAAVNARFPTDDQRAKARAIFQTLLAPGARRDLAVFPEAVQQAITDTYLPDWQVLVEHAPPDLRPDFERILRAWPHDPIPAAGASLADPEIQDETARTLAVLIDHWQRPTTRPLRRAADWFRRDPLHAPQRAWRRLRRHGT